MKDPLRDSESPASVFLTEEESSCGASQVKPLLQALKSRKKLAACGEALITLMDPSERHLSIFRRISCKPAFRLEIYSTMFQSFLSVFMSSDNVVNHMLRFSHVDILTPRLTPAELLLIHRHIWRRPSSPTHPDMSRPCSRISAINSETTRTKRIRRKDLFLIPEQTHSSTVHTTHRLLLF